MPTIVFHPKQTSMVSGECWLRTRLLCFVKKEQSCWSGRTGRPGTVSVLSWYSCFVDGNLVLWHSSDCCSVQAGNFS